MNLELLLSTLTQKPAQAYLLVGESAAPFAKRFVEKICCAERCGRCAHCHKLQTGAHPDLVWVTKSGKRISIDQIRDLQRQALYAPLEAPQKIFVIESVEDLSLEAANSLLKILEAPPAFLIFMLLARTPNILPTILSRCQIVKLPRLSRAEIESVLRERGWSPLAIDYLLSVTKGNGVAHDLDPARDVLADREQLRQRFARSADGDLWGQIASEDIFVRREAALEVLRRLRRWNSAQLLHAAATLSDAGPGAIELFIKEATYWYRDLLAAQTGAPVYNRDCLKEIESGSTDITRLAEALRALEAALWQWQRQNANLQLLLESLFFTLRAALI